MAAQRYDPETLAIDRVLRLDQLIREALGQQRCEAFARRAKEAPQLVLQAGIVHTLLFYLSKSDERLLGDLISALRGGNPALRGLKDECRGEGKGYTIAAALLADALRTLAEHGLLGGANDACRQAADARSIARCLRSLRESNAELRAEALLEPYLVAVKRLAEALHEEKDKERR